MLLVFVEDDTDMRDTVVECLHLRGYDVVEAATAEAAMQLLAISPAPALAITDIDLGAGRSGIEFSDWPHGRWPELHVIFASGRLDRLESRAFDPREAYLAKPFTLRKLIELIRDVVPSSAPANNA